MAAEVSVTIKAEGKDRPWLVFRGDTTAEVAQLIVNTFNYTDDYAHGVSLADLVQNAQADFNAVGTVVSGLGARAEKQSTDWPAIDAPAVQPTNAPQPVAEAPQGNPLIEAIKAAASLEDIQRLWMKNQSAFTDPEVQQAVKDRRAQLGA